VQRRAGRHDTGRVRPVEALARVVVLALRGAPGRGHWGRAAIGTLRGRPILADRGDGRRRGVIVLVLPVRAPDEPDAETDKGEHGDATDHTASNGTDGRVVILVSGRRGGRHRG
jgi:hypothetical protein